MPSRARLIYQCLKLVIFIAVSVAVDPTLTSQSRASEVGF
jgi:hypothetical protein